jgi:hypothetical protein
MILDNLNIYNKTWSDGSYSGSIQFKNPESTIALKLDDEACQAILEICSEQLMKTSEELAKNLVTRCIEIPKQETKELQTTNPSEAKEDVFN